MTIMFEKEQSWLPSALPPRSGRFPRRVHQGHRRAAGAGHLPGRRAVRRPRSLDCARVVATGGRRSPPVRARTGSFRGSGHGRPARSWRRPRPLRPPVLWRRVRRIRRGPSRPETRCGASPGPRCRTRTRGRPWRCCAPSTGSTPTMCSRSGMYSSCRPSDGVTRVRRHAFADTVPKVLAHSARDAYGYHHM